MRALCTTLQAVLVASVGWMTLSAQAQSASVTQQFLGTPVPNPVLAVELDAATTRAMPQQPASAVGGLGAARQGPSYSVSSPDAYTSQTAPPMFTGAGVAASAGGLADTIRAYEGHRLGR